MSRETRRSEDPYRASETRGLGSIMGSLRADVMRNATPAEREKLERAEQSRRVYRAWNEVCGGTREGRHVTGLRYLPGTNELLVYLDDASWTQEMTMLREIIRARMDRLGVKLDGFKFLTSKKEYISRATHAAADGAIDEQGRRCAYVGPAHLKVVLPERRGAHVAPRAELTAQEERRLEDAVGGIENKELASALKKAMKASFEWKKAEEA